MDLSILSGVIASPWDIIRTLLDIAIVAYVFYRILRVISGTRAEQLLKGLVLLLGFSVLISYLNLSMVKWLMEKLWIIFAITLPIVFQPELRRILEQIGRGSFFTTRKRTASQNNSEHMVRQLSAAAAVLSRNQVGALIVITRETGIGEYMESGVDLDAQVSASLLINIFVPNTPLHDGAVVISNLRIEKAACFLPLSDNPYLDPELGTRHRAGIGITEVSDAIAVIVSEETGAISIAKEGKLQRHLDEVSLRDNLLEELGGGEDWRSSLKRRWFGETACEPERES
ncbi:MAG: TIGR00159 family protein [Syntrophomonadaceae bacterium]|jgi:diadenylate cyclase|nr:TIGR00159 family protein [Syntrophomonadaceae bacterium]